MGEIKNPFNFGTGNIDKDQWLKDIDNELEDFISKYGSATNKHRTALIRLAFLDLRSRIANGDMLGRTADGLYQFSSALNREDKHMQEAYQRALGFMGNLARRLINAPVTEPEKKKYSSKILNDRFIRYFNPSGSQESFTSLWNSYDDDKRKLQLKDFLNSELSNLEKNYLDVEDYDSMDNLKTRINEFLSDPSLTNLNRLGFNRNYLSLILSDDASQTQSLTEGELLDALLALQLLERENLEKRDRINYGNNSQVITYNFDTPRYDIQADIINQTKRLTPGLNLSGIPQTQNWNTNYTNQLKLYVLSSTQELSDYFNNFRVNYQSILSNKNNIPTLSRNLARLFATIPGKEQGTTLQVYDWSKYLTHLPNGGYMINGTLENNGRFLYYTPSKGILHTNIARMDLSTYDFLRDLALLKSGYMKDGGIIKGQNGLDFSTVSLNTPLPLLKVEKAPESNEDQGMTTADWVNIAGPLALDITSMISANASPGAGTIVSGVSGLGSTLWSGIADISKEGMNKTNLGLMGTGALADLFGLVPGWGVSAKVGKIAGRLTKYGRFLMQGLKAAGYSSAASVLYKGLSGGFENLNYDDWKTLSAGISGAVKGHSSIRRSNRANLERGAATKTKVTYKNGKTELVDTDVAAKLLAEGKITNISKPIVTLETLRDTLAKIAEGMSLPQYFGLSTNRFNSMWNKAGTEGYSNWNNVELPGIKYNKEAYLNKIKGLRTKAEEVKEKAKSAIKGSDTPKNSSEVKPTKKKVTKKKTSKTQKKEIGGVLKALRNGGIIKAKWGWEVTSDSADPLEITSSSDATYMVIRPSYLPYLNLRQTINFKDASPTFFIDEDITKNKLDADRGNILNPSRGKYSVPAPNYKTLQNYKSAMDAQLAYYKADNGKNIMGDVYNYYNTWRLSNPTADYNTFITDYNKYVGDIRNLHFTKFELGPDGKPKHGVNEKGWSEFNQKHHLLYPSYGKYIDDKGNVADEYDKGIEDYLGESTWRRLPNAFDSDDDMKELRSGFLKEGDNTSYVHMKNDGTLEIIKAPEQNPNGVKEDDGKNKVVDQITGKDTILTPLFKNPIDPTLPIIGAKTAMGLIGNANIYKNLLDEMPQAPLRDPIQRQLAIVGWQDRIKNGQNQIADLRNINRRLFGSDLQTNFATSLETERTGRDISDKAFAEDSGRQFETAQKLWNLKNEDTMYNIGVGDANRRSIADRARMMAQIRAAWRSGNNNILMGALSDTGNWLMKKYQTEADTITRAKELQLGDIDQYTELKLAEDSRFKDRWNALKAKRDNKTLTPQDEVEIQRMKAEKLKEIRGLYAGEYYNLHRNPLFGRGYTMSINPLKDGGKLEVEKLKARGKDNDRYVSMIKNLRTTRSRRRRRRFYYED